MGFGRFGPGQIHRWTGIVQTTPETPESAEFSPVGPLTVEIAGVRRGVFPGSLKIEEEAQGRTTCSFKMQNRLAGGVPVVGNSLRIRWNGDIIFSGTVDEVNLDRRNGTTLVDWTVKGVDWNQIADKHTVTSSFDNATFQEIVTDLLTNYLARDGVTAGNIPVGPLFTRVVFPGMQASECFNELSTLTGYPWNINHSLELDFAPVGTFTAPFGVATNSGLFRKEKAHQDRKQYANAITLLGGKDTSSIQTEQFLGDGVTRTFTVNFPIARVPTVLRGSPGVAESVGLKNESGSAWYWGKEDQVLKQDDGEAPLAAGEVLTVEYQGLVPIVISLEDTAQIEERQAAEGGSGRYERVEKDESIDSNQLAIDRLQGLLRRFAFIPTKYEFETDTNLHPLAHRIRAGQTLAIEDSTHGIDDTFFIERLSIRTNATDRRLIVEAKCIDSEKSESWVDYFAALFRAGKRTTLREGEIVTATRSITGDEIDFADVISPTQGGIETRVGYAVVGFSEVA